MSDIFDFIDERHSIYKQRAAGEPKPWTIDPILLSYRFCNVYRELDTVTVWIKNNWREPHKDDPDLWFAMVVARFINWPETLVDIGYPVPWNPKQFLKIMEQRSKSRKKVYSGAYMIRSDKEFTGVPKAVYQEKTTFTPLWEQRERLRPKPGDTLNSYHMLLGQMFGMGSFMAAQIVADLKYAPPLKDAFDWWTFAASGPGSRRGLNRVLGRPVNSPWTEDEWRFELGRLRDQLVPRFKEAKIPTPHAQDIQNCLCEFDKYERVRLGEGRPRSRYNGN